MGMPDHLARQLRRVRREGVKDSIRRVVRLAHTRIGAAELDFPLLSGDVADSTRLRSDLDAPVRSSSTPLNIGWVCAPPSLGSGGHTTMFRMVEALEASGHNCQILLYDRHHGEAHRYAAVIRNGWPNVKASVHMVGGTIPGLDGCVATSWPTAHVLASRLTDSTRGFYFIQDYEPFFHPRGSMYELAADSYRFGFFNLALGHMVADCIADELGVGSTVLPFGCDTDVYSLSNNGSRRGVVFYAKPGVPRRGYELAVLALREFNRLRPDQPIHVYGGHGRDLGIPVTTHDRLSPADLNLLYNGAITGLAMSFTNISLVAEEMLAAGAIPVVNDSPYSRADIGNKHVAWTTPTPAAIADTLVRLVDEPNVASRAKAAASSVRLDGWARTTKLLVSAIEGELQGTWLCTDAGRRQIEAMAVREETLR